MILAQTGILKHPVKRNFVANELHCQRNSATRVYNRITYFWTNLNHTKFVEICHFNFLSENITKSAAMM